MRKKPQHIRFSEIRELITKSRISDENKPFISEDFAIVKDAQLLLKTLQSADTPFIIEDIRTGIILKGSADVTVNLIHYHLEEGMMAVIPYGAIVRPDHISSDFSLMGLVAQRGYLQSALGNSQLSILKDQSLFVLRRCTDEEFAIAHQLLDSMWKYVHLPSFGRNVISAGIKMYFTYIDQLLQNDNEEGKEHKYIRQEMVFHKFIALVNKYCNREHTIDFYAQELCLSSHYLSTLIKETSGSTAKEWIDQAIITQAKVLLNSTDLQASQVSDRMGFPNASFFSKFFKRHTGQTPQQYRESHS